METGVGRCCPAKPIFPTGCTNTCPHPPSFSRSLPRWRHTPDLPTCPAAKAAPGAARRERAALGTQTCPHSHVRIDPTLA
eukprot:354873-Chlamydomonas_euryale.AAC.7